MARAGSCWGPYEPTWPCQACHNFSCTNPSLRSASKDDTAVPTVYSSRANTEGIAADWSQGPRPLVSALTDLRQNIGQSDRGSPRIKTWTSMESEGPICTNLGLGSSFRGQSCVATGLGGLAKRVARLLF